MKESACIEKRRIATELAATLNAMREIGSREIAAITTGDVSTLNQLEVEMEQANARKDALMVAYKNHVDTHGC